MMERLITDVSLGRDSFYTIMTAFQNENVNIEAVTVNDPAMARTCHGMLHLLEHLYTDIPVCKGSTGYLDEEGAEDKSTSFWPDDVISPISAWEMICLKVSLYPGEVTVISHSPLTDIAVFLREHSDAARKLKKLVILENRTPDARAEGLDFAPPADAKALREVLASPLDIYLIPRNLLKVTDKNRPLIERIKEGRDTMIGRFLHHSTMADNDEAIVSSLAACLTAFDSGALKSKRWNVACTEEGERKGCFLLGKGDDIPNVNVVTAIDFKRALKEGFGVADTDKTRAYNKLHEGEGHHHD